MSVAQARRTLFFWVMLSAVALNAGIATAVGCHQISILTERGLTPAAAVGASALGPVIYSLGQSATGNFTAILLASSIPALIVLVMGLRLDKRTIDLRATP
jgi:uncharacterized membrane protein YhaH (DUF805 family)